MIAILPCYLEWYLLSVLCTMFALLQTYKKESGSLNEAKLNDFYLMFILCIVPTIGLLVVVDSHSEPLINFLTKERSWKRSSSEQ